MSGIEVAGLILGAFPIAIEALDKYREVATRAGLFYQIKLKHRQCRNVLEREKLVFIGNLKQLLLPIVADDEKIGEMLSDPGGPSWQDKATADLLRARLKDSHDVYMDCIKHLDDVMKELIVVLALDSDTVQKSLKSSKPPTTRERVNNAMTKSGIEYQVYKVKFSNSESIRNSLFKQLDEWNKSLEQLLGISDKETQLLQDRQASGVTSVIDFAICNFWISANKLFEALVTAWQCSCQGQHSTRLLLQHRDTKKSDFGLLFAKSEDSKWTIQETNISEDDDLASESVKSNGKTVALMAGGLHQPAHWVKVPKKSALKSNSQKTIKLAPSVTINTSTTTLPAPICRPITSLCVSLNDKEVSCYGYLPHGDCRYYVYRVSHKNTEKLTSVTLDQVFRGHLTKFPNRRQRLAISLILASSFLQLLSTPWITVSWAKSDITFMMDPNEPGTYALGRPHLSRNLATRDGENQSDEDITKSLRQLGIVLLELCFGKLLEDQPCRKRLPSIDDKKVKYSLDLIAALDWLQEVEGEAGPDYECAVKWCLVATRPSRWRQEMLQKVVKPLEACHQYMVSQPPW